jgi:hypothetical protein
MSPERKPPNGELGGFTIGDVAAAIAVESADMLARVLRRLEARGACDEPAPTERKILPATPGDDFRVEIPWRGGENRIFRRVAMFPKMIGEKCHNWSRWEGTCVMCGRPFIIEALAGIKSPNAKAFAVTTCETHRKITNKGRAAPAVAGEDRD